MNLRSIRGFLAVLVALSAASAQQPNSASATLVVNQNNPGGNGPFSVAAPGDGALTLDLSGTPLSPFALLWGVTQAGAVPTGLPSGILDLAYPTPPPQFIFNGLAPTTILDLFANTNGAGTWGLQASLNNTSLVAQFGLQALVVDFTVGFPFFVLTAATDVTIGNFTTSTVSFAEPGDDTTITYYHQITSFPFYGLPQGRTNIDTNGYLSFGAAIDSQWQTSAVAFLSGPPRIAPYWSDMHMSSVVPSAFGNLSLAPASFVITETATGPSTGVISFDWRFSTEAAGAVAQWDYRCTIDSNGVIVFTYGPALGPGALIAASGNVFAIVGISPGGGLSTNTASQDLVFNSAVNGGVPFVVTSAFDAIFQVFDPAVLGPFVVDVQVSPVNFIPTAGFPAVYIMQ